MRHFCSSMLLLHHTAKVVETMFRMIWCLWVYVCLCCVVGVFTLKNECQAQNESLLWIWLALVCCCIYSQDAIMFVCLCVIDHLYRMCLKKDVKQFENTARVFLYYISNGKIGLSQRMDKFLGNGTRLKNWSNWRLSSASPWPRQKANS